MVGDGRRRLLPVLVASFVVISALGIYAVAAASPPLLSSLGKLSPKVLAAAFGGDGSQPARLLIETYGRAPSSLLEQIQAAGGTVLQVFEYTPAVAAYVPAASLLAVAQSPYVKRIYFDELVQLAASPQAGGLDVSTLFDIETVDGESEAVPLTADDMSRFSPQNFINSALSGVTPEVLAESDAGANTILGIIDTGINSRHAAFTPKNPDGTSTRVIGGRDVSCDGELSGDPFCAPGAGRPASFVPLPGVDRPENHFHGSFVAAVAAGSGAVSRPASGTLVRSIEFWTGAPLPPGPTGTKLIPLIGIAPAAELFIIKVFDHTGLGVPTSFVINAINIAIGERVAEGVDIDVINMSLGGSTLFDGRDLEDRTVDLATTQGILSVSAAGNDGPASMTVSSPGSAQTGLAVAAAADPTQVRIRRDQQLGVGNGALAFVSDDVQVIFFSSRGPTSDGRGKPDLIAAGTFLLSAFAAGSSTGLAFGSGTSFSSPAVAGAAAILNSFAEDHDLAATPFDYKQALRESADSDKVPFYSREARGRGFLDVAGALENLEEQAEEDELGDVEKRPRGVGALQALPTVELDDDGFNKKLSLAPGHIREFVFAIPQRTVKHVKEIHVQVDVTNLGDNPLAGVGPFPGNSVSVYVQSAKRTTLDAFVDGVLVVGQGEFTITDDKTTATGDLIPFAPGQLTSHVIEPGFLRVNVDTDWRSFDTVKFKLELKIELEKPARPDVRVRGAIGQDEIVVVGPFALGEGNVIELSWKHDWTVYPTSDVDMYLFDAGTGDLISFAGATLNSPERVRLKAGATVLVVLVGFEINPPGKSERWVLSIFE